MDDGQGILGQRGGMRRRMISSKYCDITGAPVFEKSPNPLCEAFVVGTNFKTEICEQAPVGMSEKEFFDRVIERLQFLCTRVLDIDDQPEDVLRKIAMDLIHDGKREFFLAAEVIVETTFRDAAGLNNFVNARSRVALGAKKLGRSIQ